jgi:FHA domain
MRITGCVPLAGEGVIARHGTLVAVTDGRGPDPDPMLSALAGAAAAAGDGRDLVLRAARAALGSWPQSSWACAGVMADGGVAVLVHGRAMATVQAEGGPEVTLTASETMLPVTRTFTGATVVVGLSLGQQAQHAQRPWQGQPEPPPDPRFWLGEGVMPGGGLTVTVTASPAAPPAVVAPTHADLNAVAAVSAEDAEDPFGWHPPTMNTPAAGAPVPGPPAGEPAGADDPQAVLVDGVLCARGHFNDPGEWSCRRCGIGLDQPPRQILRGPRPPLGVLELDDGTRFTLDGDYVLGREPALDGDVLAGRARPMRINDPNGTVSRLHLKISLANWRVEVTDLGSANGSVLHLPGEERPLPPFEPTIVEPGARIGIGHRSMQYLAYQGVLP